MTLVFTGSIGGTFTVGVGFITPTNDTTTPTEPITGALTLTARLSVGVEPPQQPKIIRRARSVIWADPDEPVIINGRPRSPRWHGAVVPTGTLLTGTGHFRDVPDPDPVWNGASWDVPPPAAPAGAHFMRWTANQLPDPAAHGGEYPLGFLDTVDGTSGLPSAAHEWESAPGSDFDISWQSDYPFKPMVREYAYFGDDGSAYTRSVAVHFTPHHVEHMWADFGSVLAPPFTVLVVGVITGFTGPNDRTHVLDGGQDPTTGLSLSLRKNWLNNGVKGDTALPGEQGLGYRTGLRVDTNFQHLFNDQNPTTQIGRVPFNHTRKPKVFYGVFDGSNSALGNISAFGHQRREITLANNGPQRLTVLGRRNGIISPDYASAMVVFEIRAWDKALTEDELDAQYAQLATTWGFHEFRSLGAR